MQDKVLVSFLFFVCVSSKGNHTILKYINRGKKINDKTETGQDYYDAFDELTRGFEAIEEQRKMTMTPYEGKPIKPGGQSVPEKSVPKIEKDRHPESNKRESPNNNIQKNSKACQENFFNIWSKNRIGPKEVPNVKSASDCSGKCSERSSCKHWIWHKETAGRFAYQCVTITGFKQKNQDGNTVFGDRGCLAGNSIFCLFFIYLKFSFFTISIS